MFENLFDESPDAATRGKGGRMNLEVR